MPFRWLRPDHLPEKQGADSYYEFYSYGLSGLQTPRHRSSSRACRRCFGPVSRKALRPGAEWPDGPPRNSSAQPTWWPQNTACQSSAGKENASLSGLTHEPSSHGSLRCSPRRLHQCFIRMKTPLPLLPIPSRATSFSASCSARVYSRTLLPSSPALSPSCFSSIVAHKHSSCNYNCKWKKRRIMGICKENSAVKRGAS